MNGNDTDLSLGHVHGRHQDSVEKNSWLKNRLKRVVGTKKKPVLLLLMGVFLVCAMAGVWFFLMKEAPQEETISGRPSKPQEAGQALHTEVVFEDIIVLAPFERIQMKETSDMKQISLSISLETTDSRYKKQVSAMEEMIRKIIQDQVSKMTWLELRNPEGKIQLKYELLKQINAVFPQVMVRNLYFTHFLMQ